MGKISSYSPDNVPATGDYALGNKVSALSTQRFLFSDLINLFFNNVPAGKILPNGLVSGSGTSWVSTDISAISTINGWSAFTIKQLRQMQIGKLVHVFYYIAGTSNNTVTNFTVSLAPATTLNEYEGVSGLHIDNGTPGTQPRWNLISSGSTVSFYTSYAGGGWTASGSKEIRGMLTYETP